MGPGEGRSGRVAASLLSVDHVIGRGIHPRRKLP